MGAIAPILVLENIMKYIEDSVDYPNNIFADPLPYGTMWGNISNSFLNGFINYGKIVKAFVLGRYRSWDELIENLEVKGQTKKTWTKHELYEHHLANPEHHTSKIDYKFQDDVLILEQSKDDPTVYMMFWYDRDCSDCCILRFKTEDPVEEVIAEFSKYVNELPCNDDGEREIPVTFFRGWLSS